MNYVSLKKEATGIHFSSVSHSVDNLIVQFIEKVSPNTPFHLTIRENYWIITLKTKKHGLNTNLLYVYVFHVNYVCSNTEFQFNFFPIILKYSANFIKTYSNTLFQNLYFLQCSTLYSAATNLEI